eukprot:Gb_14925 [translate_table: standard]
MLEKIVHDSCSICNIGLYNIHE